MVSLHYTSFSKYTSLSFAERKLNRKKSLFVNLRKINSVIADDYTSNNQLVSSLPVAAQHLRGKSDFCQLGCSQAYHCLQMVDQRSMKTLEFKNSSRIFAYYRVAQSLSISVTSFSSLMRGWLDPVVKANQCYQYMDDIGIAANNATNLTRKVRAIFMCLREAR